MTLTCSICGTEISESETYVGTGDGSGNSFAHQLCYWRRLARKLEAELSALKPVPLLPLDEQWQHLPPPLPIDQACEIWLRLEPRAPREINVLTPNGLSRQTDEGDLPKAERQLYEALTRHLTHAANIVGVRASEVES